MLDAIPIVATLPDSLLERSLVAPELLAQIVVSKYCDHLPLYRQEAIYWTRHQVWLPRQTMAEWVGLAAEWLQPIHQHIRQGVLDDGYLEVDETPIRYLPPGHGRTKLGYLWTCCAPHGDVIFHWETSRAATCLEKIIPVDFRGTLQCDGYEAYDCFARRRGPHIVLAGCLAHVRRKLYDAREGDVGNVRRFPIGGIAGLIPFNFQLNLADHKIAPVIASGSYSSFRRSTQVALFSGSRVSVSRA